MGSYTPPHNSKIWYAVDVCINDGKVAYFSYCPIVRGVMKHLLKINLNTP